jgi:hypothetical protein
MNALPTARGKKELFITGFEMTGIRSSGGEASNRCILAGSGHVAAIRARREIDEP